ncbi:MAG: ABC-2 family transporter protein [Candidatus Dojkabacteria bacterium]
MYFALIKFTFLRYAHYPLEVFAVVARKMLEIGGLLVFWYVVGKTGNLELETKFLLLYFLIGGAVSEIVMVSSLKWGRNIQKLVKRGALSVYLIRPVSFLRYHLAYYVGSSGIDYLLAFLNLAIGIIILGELSIARVTLFLLFLITSFFLSIALNIFIAIIALYTEEAKHFKNVANHIIRIFSGILVPITFFPEALEKITQWSPFPVLVFGPVNSLQSGEWTGDFGQQLLIGGVWILLLLPLSIFLWRYSLKKYDGVGI